MAEETAQLEDEQEIEPQDPTSDAEGGEDERDEPRRESKTVPLAALVQERKEFQSKIHALEDKLSKLEQTATKKAEESGDSNEEVKRARAQWRKALGIEELQETLSGLKDTLSAITEDFESVKATTARTEEQYYGQIEGFIMQTFYDPARHPIDQRGYAQLFAQEIGPGDEDAILSGGPEGMAVLEKVAKRVEKYFPGLTNAAKRTGDLRKVSTLPKVPGRGGAPAPEGPEEPVTGRALHQKAGSLLQDILASRK